MFQTIYSCFIQSELCTGFTQSILAIQAFTIHTGLVQSMLCLHNLIDTLNICQSECFVPMKHTFHLLLSFQRWGLDFLCSKTSRP